ncbi:MAG: hypothetical protein ABIO57_00725 [Candidatus Paceibacterota bacterium]
MKKKINLVWMLIVLSFTYITPTFAQTAMGSGMFITYVQHEENLERVKYNYYYGMFGSYEQKHRIFRALDQISCDEIISITNAEISRQMGEQFDPSHPEMYSVTYEIVSGSWWDNWEDSYLIDGQDNQLHWGDPRKFKLNLPYPNKQYLIATITNIQTGATAKSRANCGNVLRQVTQTTGYRQVEQQPVRQVTYQQQQPAGCDIFLFTAVPQTSYGPGQEIILSWKTSCQSVTISGFASVQPGSGDLAVNPTQTTTYTLTTSSGKTATVTIAVLNPNATGMVVKKPNHTLRNVGIVTGAAVVVGVLTKLIFFNGHGSGAGGGGSYNNGFQGGSDGSGASGGSGGSQTW